VDILVERLGAAPHLQALQAEWKRPKSRAKYEAMSVELAAERETALLEFFNKHPEFTPPTDLSKLTNAFRSFSCLLENSDFTLFSTTSVNSREEAQSRREGAYTLRGSSINHKSIN